MISVGITGLARETVTPEKTAEAVGSGTHPVYATPCMAALMERAAYTSVAPYLEEGQASVGTGLELRHLAATPVGETVEAVSRVTEVDGRKVTFLVTVSDGAGVIGEATHTRAVIDTARFLAGAENRAARFHEEVKK